jgi:hypothetical protein|tara:strand:+ start:254 stop:547 length:294 start_codon:yes stop_codon:yes gene_type:complete
MSLITYIDGIPVYTTIEESISWASQYNLPGYHEHVVSGRLGYMGGVNHLQISQAIKGVVPQQQTAIRLESVALQVQPTNPTQTTQVIPPPSNTSSGY